MKFSHSRVLGTGSEKIVNGDRHSARGVGGRVRRSSEAGG